MRRLGRTELHRIIEEECGSKWTPDGQTAAELYLLNRRHGILVSDIADVLGVSRADQKEDREFCGIFSRSPREVLAAFDQVRQAELEWQQGVEVSLRSSDRQLAALLSLIEAVEARDAADTERVMHYHGTDVRRAAKQIRKALGPYRRRLDHYKLTLD